MQFVLSAVTGIAFAVLGWATLSFIGAPIRRFWDLRGEATKALHTYARFISGPPSLDITLDKAESTREDAVREFRRVGTMMITFADSESLAARVLSRIGLNPRSAGILFLELARALTERNSLGPRRSEIAATLRLQP